jgi:hypothetical protein
MIASRIVWKKLILNGREAILRETEYLEYNIRDTEAKFHRGPLARFRYLNSHFH